MRAVLRQDRLAALVHEREDQLIRGGLEQEQVGGPWRRRESLEMSLRVHLASNGRSNWLVRPQ